MPTEDLKEEFDKKEFAPVKSPRIDSVPPYVSPQKRKKGFNVDRRVVENAPDILVYTGGPEGDSVEIERRVEKQNFP